MAPPTPLHPHTPHPPTPQKKSKEISLHSLISFWPRAGVAESGKLIESRSHNLKLTYLPEPGKFDTNSGRFWGVPGSLLVTGWHASLPLPVSPSPTQPTARAASRASAGAWRAHRSQGPNLARLGCGEIRCCGEYVECTSM